MSRKKKKQPIKTIQQMQEKLEEIQQPETQPIEPMDAPQESINDRLGQAYIAKEYTLLNGGSDNVIMIQATRKDRYPIDVLLTFEGLEEVVNQLRPDTQKKAEESNEL